MPVIIDIMADADCLDARRERAGTEVLSISMIVKLDCAFDGARC